MARADASVPPARRVPVQGVPSSFTHLTTKNGSDCFFCFNKATMTEYNYWHRPPSEYYALAAACVIGLVAFFLGRHFEEIWIISKYSLQIFGLSLLILLGIARFYENRKRG